VPNGNGNGAIRLPPGATLVDSSGGMNLPPGATLVSGGGSQPSAADLDTQLHQAYDNRPLWRKVLGLDPDASELSPELQNHLAQQKQAAQRQVASQLQGVYSGYGQGLKSGAMAAPFVVAAPIAGAAAAEAAGGGALGLGANVLAQGLTGATIAGAEGATPRQAAISGALTAAGPVLEAAAAPTATALEQSAARTYGQVLKPTTQAAKFTTQKIMPQLVEERPVALTRTALAEKAATQAEEYGQQIEQTVEGMKGQMTMQPVLDSLNDLRQTYTINGVSLRPEVDAAIDTVSNTLGKLGPEVSYQDAVQARRVLDQAVAEARGYQGATLSDASLASIRREAATSFRTELAKASPDLAALNAKYKFWNGLSDVMDATALRQTGQADPLGQTLQTAAGIGAGVVKAGAKGGGAYGTAAYALGKLFRSTAWKTASAATKANLADALASGDLDAVSDLLTKFGAAQAAGPPPPGAMATAVAQRQP
jgi:hypothetical protein